MCYCIDGDTCISCAETRGICCRVEGNVLRPSLPASERCLFVFTLKNYFI